MAFVGRQILILYQRPQPERVTMHHALEFSHMLRHLFPGILCHGCMESLLAALTSYPGDILVVHEVGGYGEYEYRLQSAFFTLGSRRSSRSSQPRRLDLSRQILPMNFTFPFRAFFRAWRLRLASTCSFLAIVTDDDIIVRGSEV